MKSKIFSFLFIFACSVISIDLAVMAALVNYGMNRGLGVDEN